MAEEHEGRREPTSLLVRLAGTLVLLDERLADWQRRRGSGPPGGEQATEEQTLLWERASGEELNRLAMYLQEASLALPPRLRPAQSEWWDSLMVAQFELARLLMVAIVTEPGDRSSMSSELHEAVEEVNRLMRRALNASFVDLVRFRRQALYIASTELAAGRQGRRQQRLVDTLAEIAADFEVWDRSYALLSRIAPPRTAEEMARWAGQLHDLAEQLHKRPWRWQRRWQRPVGQLRAAQDDLWLLIAKALARNKDEDIAKLHETIEQLRRLVRQALEAASADLGISETSSVERTEIGAAGPAAEPAQGLDHVEDGNDDGGPGEDGDEPTRAHWSEQVLEPERTDAPNDPSVAPGPLEPPEVGPPLRKPGTDEPVRSTPEVPSGPGQWLIDASGPREGDRASSAESVAGLAVASPAAKTWLGLGETVSASVIQDLLEGVDPWTGARGRQAKQGWAETGPIGLPVGPAAEWLKAAGYVGVQIVGAQPVTPRPGGAREPRQGRVVAICKLDRWGMPRPLHDEDRSVISAYGQGLQADVDAELDGMLEPQPFEINGRLNPPQLPPVNSAVLAVGLAADGPTLTSSDQPETGLTKPGVVLVRSDSTEPSERLPDRVPTSSMRGLGHPIRGEPEQPQARWSDRSGRSERPGPGGPDRGSSRSEGRRRPAVGQGGSGAGGGSGRGGGRTGRPDDEDPRATAADKRAAQQMRDYCHLAWLTDIVLPPNPHEAVVNWIAWRGVIGNWEVELLAAREEGQVVDAQLAACRELWRQLGEVYQERRQADEGSAHESSDRTEAPPRDGSEDRGADSGAGGGAEGGDEEPGTTRDQLDAVRQPGREPPEPSLPGALPRPAPVPLPGTEVVTAGSNQALPTAPPQEAELSAPVTVLGQGRFPVAIGVAGRQGADQPRGEAGSSHPGRWGQPQARWSGWWRHVAGLRRGRSEVWPAPVAGRRRAPAERSSRTPPQPSAAEGPAQALAELGLASARAEERLRPVAEQGRAMFERVQAAEERVDAADQEAGAARDELVAAELQEDEELLQAAQERYRTAFEQWEAALQQRHAAYAVWEPAYAAWVAAEEELRQALLSESLSLTAISVLGEAHTRRLAEVRDRLDQLPAAEGEDEQPAVVEEYGILVENSKADPAFLFGDSEDAATRLTEALNARLWSGREPTKSERDETPDQLREAAAALDQATQFDTDAGLADVYRRAAEHGGGAEEQDTSVDERPAASGERGADQSQASDDPGADGDQGGAAMHHVDPEPAHPPGREPPEPEQITPLHAPAIEIVAVALDRPVLVGPVQAEAGLSVSGMVSGPFPEAVGVAIGGAYQPRAQAGSSPEGPEEHGHGRPGPWGGGETRHAEGRRGGSQPGRMDPGLEAEQERAAQARRAAAEVWGRAVAEWRQAVAAAEERKQAAAAAEEQWRLAGEPQRATAAADQARQADGSEAGLRGAAAAAAARQQVARKLRGADEAEERRQAAAALRRAVEAALTERQAAAAAVVDLRRAAEAAVATAVGLPTAAAAAVLRRAHAGLRRVSATAEKKVVGAARVVEELLAASADEDRLRAAEGQLRVVEEERRQTWLAEYRFLAAIWDRDPEMLGDAGTRRLTELLNLLGPEVQEDGAEEHDQAQPPEAEEHESGHAGGDVPPQPENHLEAAPGQRPQFAQPTSGERARSEITAVASAHPPRTETAQQRHERRPHGQEIGPGTPEREPPAAPRGPLPVSALPWVVAATPGGWMPASRSDARRRERAQAPRFEPGEVEIVLTPTGPAEEELELSPPDSNEPEQDSPAKPGTRPIPGIQPTPSVQPAPAPDPDSEPMPDNPAVPRADPATLPDADPAALPDADPTAPGADPATVPGPNPAGPLQPWRLAVPIQARAGQVPRAMPRQTLEALARELLARRGRQVRPGDLAALVRRLQELGAKQREAAAAGDGQGQSAAKPAAAQAHQDPRREQPTEPGTVASERISGARTRVDRALSSFEQVMMQVAQPPQQGPSLPSEPISYAVPGEKPPLYPETKGPGRDQARNHLEQQTRTARLSRIETLERALIEARQAARAAAEASQVASARRQSGPDPEQHAPRTGARAQASVRYTIPGPNPAPSGLRPARGNELGGLVKRESDALMRRLTQQPGMRDKSAALIVALQKSSANRARGGPQQAAGRDAGEGRAPAMAGKAGAAGAQSSRAAGPAGRG